MQQRMDLERGKHGEEATGHGEEGLLSWVPRAAQAAGSPVLYQMLCVVSASYVVTFCLNYHLPHKETSLTRSESCTNGSV